MTIEEAKNMDLVDYLASLGFTPHKIHSPSYWYLSPFRDEKDPSFKVNRQLNRWYDWGGDGPKGGSLIDFGIQYYHCSVSDLLRRLSNSQFRLSPHHQNEVVGRKAAESHGLQILSTHHISAYPLVSYLRERKIAEDIADAYLREVRYQNGGKTFYALGFKNDLGGYELRSRGFKGSSSPKGITYIEKGSSELAVFEGFFDFLSYCTMHYKQAASQRNFLVLNSASFFKQSLPRMTDFKQVHLFLDNDKTGDHLIRQAIGLNKDIFLDERHIYHGHKDLNDWLIHCFIRQRQRQKP